MEVIYGLENWQDKYKRIFVALGNFDGIHLGHQQIIKSTLEQARLRDGTAMVMTFEPHPEKVLAPGNSPPLLTTGAQKARLLRKMGVDVLLLLQFDQLFRKMKPREFIIDILKSKLGVAGIIVGYNYRFGHRGAGTIGLLRRFGEEMSISITVVPPVVVGGSVVSSTLIRQLLREGKVGAATELLGRYPALEGIVIHGNKRGRDLGFPTANLQVSREFALSRGVYVVRCRQGHHHFSHGVANVGICPTFGSGEIRVEINLFDFQGALYGERLSVEFMEFLRPEREFKSSRELQEQIRRDVRRAKEFIRGIELQKTQK